MTEYELLTAKLPVRVKNGNKGRFGLLSVVAGSNLYRGAAALSVEAALRCGVGIVRLVSTDKIISSVAAKVSECVFLPISENSDGGICSRDLISNIKRISDSTAILVGCGMTASYDTEVIVSSLLSNCECPLLIDADGLNVLKSCPERLTTANKTPIITPHIGEMSRLTGLSVEHIKKDRVSVAGEFSQKYGCVTVLKDSVSVIASPRGEYYICERENSGLSKGGSGDTLSGIIASLLAQNMDAYDSAVCGVILHSLAAEAAVYELTEEAMLPSDIIKMLPTIYRKIRKEREK